MARTSDRDRDRRRAPKEAARRGKKKVCHFCAEHINWVDYKDANLLRRYMSDRGKIRARRVSGNCDQHQRAVAIAIKTARELALLPYSQRTVAERGGSRGPRAPRYEESPAVRGVAVAEPDADKAETADEEPADEDVDAAYLPEPGALDEPAGAASADEADEDRT